MPLREAKGESFIGEGRRPKFVQHRKAVELGLIAVADIDGPVHAAARFRSAKAPNAALL